MHNSQRRHMALSIKRYLPKDRRVTVLDVGSRNTQKVATHRDLLEGCDVEYIGIDLQEGPNVDRVMPKPYRFPVKSRSIDVVISGSVFEHVPFPWVTMLEIARVLKPGGHAFITAPSRGHEHNVYDCWRYYPDGYRALAAWSRLRVVEVFCDLPAFDKQAKERLYDYKSIDVVHSYWGDSVAVVRKPLKKYPELRIAALRAVVSSVANRTTELPKTRRKNDPERQAVHVW